MTSVKSGVRRRKLKLKWYVLSPCVMLASLVLLLAAAALLLSGGTLSFDLAGELVTACVFLSAVLGGICAASGRGGRVLQTGALAGFALAAFILIVTLALPGGGAPGADSLRYAIAALAGGALGGAFCIKRGKRRPRRKRGK